MFPVRGSMTIILAVLLALTVSAAGYFYLQGKQTPGKSTIGWFVEDEENLKNRTFSTPTPDPTEDWKTYQNKLWGFSLKYPQDKLVACSPTDESGLRLWTAPFDCPDGHDIFYEISAIGYKQNDYKQYKKPASTSKIQVAGKEATLNIIKYDDTDGPLQSSGGSTEVLISTNDGLIQLVLLGEKPEQKGKFNQILSTFKFTK
ncbi:MAG: hypothetical protein Q8R11_00685 [bacterium]|nr:hypothetical protein [bacterium]